MKHMKKSAFFAVIAFVLVLFVSCSQKNTSPKGFVYLAEAVPDAILEIRYYSTYNFVGDRIDGYEKPVALTRFCRVKIPKLLENKFCEK